MANDLVAILSYAFVILLFVAGYLIYTDKDKWP